MKTLHLSLKKRWFDMILSGEKKEEYRESKPYWKKRLGWSDTGHDIERIKFVNGYGDHRPWFIIECKALQWGKGYEKWGATGDNCYILKLGKILDKGNI